MLLHMSAFRMLRMIFIILYFLSTIIMQRVAMPRVWVRKKGVHWVGFSGLIEVTLCMVEIALLNDCLWHGEVIWGSLTGFLTYMGH